MASGFLPFGVLQRPHGVSGEILLRPYGGASPRPSDWRLPARLRLVGPAGDREVAVASARAVADGFLVCFDGIGDRDGVASLVGYVVELPRETLGRLGAAEFFVEEIVGCEVFRAGAGRLGRVRGTYWNGAQDIMVVVAEDGAESLLPVLPEYVRHFDRERRLLVVDPHD